MSELSPLTTIAGQWASLGDLTGRQMDKYKLKYIRVDIQNCLLSVCVCDFLKMCTFSHMQISL